MLQERCKQYQQHKLSEDLYALRFEMKFDHYLVNTRREERSGDDQTRADLEEELEKTGNYDS